MASYNKDRTFLHLLDELQEMQALDAKAALESRPDDKTLAEYKIEIGDLPIALVHSELADPERFSILYPLKDVDAQSAEALQAALECNLRFDNANDMKFGFDPQSKSLVLIAKCELARNDAYDLVDLISGTEELAETWRALRRAKAGSTKPTLAD